MVPNLFCLVAGEAVLRPAPLPEVAIATDGRTFSDLAGQVDRGDLTLADLATLFALWPATVTETPYDPETEAPTDLVMTLDRKAKTVAAVRGKRALTAEEIAARNPIPDNPTLGDWRVALVLWGRLADVLGRIKALVDAGNPLGVVAQERVEYSNNVLLAQLLQLKDVFGFTEADVIESLWRADRVSKGDLSGVWPLPEAA